MASKAASFFASHYHVLVPCVLIVLYVSPLVFYMVPNNFDVLDESFEPVKTLKFVHSKGQAAHKWGPMPNFIYAPVYGLPMVYWFLTGAIDRPGTDYPYGFTRPFEQQGTLIVLARITGILIALACTALLGRALARMTGSRRAAFLTLTLCIATSPGLLSSFVSTKPDGLMLAFLAASLAIYAEIVADGLTRRRGCLLSVLAVSSISCKELTAPVYLLPYIGLAITGLAHRGGESGTRRRFLIDFGFTVAAGIIGYLLINVVYAPSAWRERMTEWLAGPGKDPAVWAPPGYTTHAYLRDALNVALDNLGIGGAAVVLAALLISILAPIRNRVLLWLPALGFLAIVLRTAGYMPRYFLYPLNVALTLPVCAALAFVDRRWAAGAPRAMRAAALLMLGPLCLVNGWTANLAWARAFMNAPWVEERYCVRQLGRRELIHTGNLWVRQPGADRLSYLGFEIDDRPLGEIQSDRGRMPDVILTGRAQLIWLEDFKKRPARNAMMKATGYDYSRFPGYESMGYRLVQVLRPRLPRFLDVSWLPGTREELGTEVLVYRRASEKE